MQTERTGSGKESFPGEQLIVIGKIFGRAARLDLGNKLLFFIFATLFIIFERASSEELIQNC